MSMPSDVTPDISDETAERARRTRRRGEHFSAEQQGLIVAALVAFLGVAYFGPTLRRAVRRPLPVDRATRQLEEKRKRARKAGSRAKKRVRRLGGGSIL